MYRVYNMNEKNKYTNDILETIDTIDINDIQNLSSIIIFPEQKSSYRGSKRDNYKTKHKINLESSPSPSSPKSRSEVEEKSINSRTPSSNSIDDISGDKDRDISKRIRYTNSNSNSPKSISRNSPNIENRRILTDMRGISRESSENEEKQLLRILKNHNKTTKKSINLRK